ncbi:DUF393 domain-containing protein [Marinomonas sp. C2222]|uniref:DUF393 domain-containing protein n=1 Tax=Marinomonas sargassi TaxID=2984494 RepID=A0ABT2YNX4_9GAMM|nr:DUF393 domain-containing protein [Marinomonas sargassi]MCV2401603.1 DUF393 domain-containing protein [Marinomonas sargassi]
MLTIFYDGNCPLCKAEMNQLQQLDLNNNLSLENIHAEDFQLRFPDISPSRADQILHGQLATGEMIYGLDVTCLAWKTVGKHSWMQALRWPLIRPIADIIYLGFARYRHPITKLIFRNEKRCETGSCQPRPKKEKG